MIVAALLSFLKTIGIYLFVCLPLELLGMVVLPVVLPFIPANQEVLPKYLRWFDNASTYVGFVYPAGDGLSGDVAYREMRKAEGHTNLFWERYYWLALRNPINYFSVVVLGSKGIFQTIEVYGDPETDHGKHDGFCVSVAVDQLSGKKVIQVYYVKTYNLFGLHKTFWIRWGNKIGQHIGDTWVQANYVFSLNPVQPSIGDK